MAAWRADQQAMLDEARRDEATLLAERAQIAQARLRYRDAASLFAEAAEVASFDPPVVWQLSMFRAASLAVQGRDFGDSAAISEAIVVYNRFIADIPRSSAPLVWATAQNDLGCIYAFIGEIQSDTK